MKERWMSDKTRREIRAVDQKGVVEGVLMSHFLPDMAGNSRAFSRQKVDVLSATKSTGEYRFQGLCMWQ